MADSSLTDRFPLLDRPVAVPGCCMSCKKGSVRVFDLRRNFFQHGAAYLCEECVGEMARALNLVPAELVSAAEAKASQPLSDFLTANNLKVVTNEFYNTLMGAVTSLPTHASDSDVLVSSLLAAPAGEGAEGNANDASNANGGPVEPPAPSANEDRKPAKRKGSASVSVDSGDGANVLDL